MSLSRMVIDLLLNLQQVLGRVDHSAILRSVRNLHRLVTAAQTESAHRRLDVFQLTGQALLERDLDVLAGCHGQFFLTDQPRISSRDLPRFAAMSSGDLAAASAFTVARTTLMGLREP